MDVTTSVAQQATAVAERTDGCNALSLGEILSDMIQNSCWGAQYAYYAADWDDHDELIDDSYAVSDTAETGLLFVGCLSGRERRWVLMMSSGPSGAVTLVCGSERLPMFT